MKRIRITNAQLIDAFGDHGKDHGKQDIYLYNGIIEAIRPVDDVLEHVDETIDAGGHILTPAFIDLHAHLREPGQEYKEDLHSGLSAAAAGGFGTVVSMANTAPPVDDANVVAGLMRKAESIGQARLRPAATLSRGLQGKELTDFAALQQAGAVMITDDGIPVVDSHLMRRACEYAAELGLVIQTHSEDPSLRQAGAMNEGVVSQRLGLTGNPIAAEAIMIYRDCELAAMTGARVHIAHVSSKRGLEVVKYFKAQGAPVTCEVTPHHLTLTDEALNSFDPVFKVAPPLRTAEDVEFLRHAVADGWVDCIGTDHAPHSQAEKEQDMLSAPFGIANIEVTFPLLYSELVLKDVLELEQLLKMLQAGPAEVMGWDAPRLEVGAVADVTLLDVEEARAVDPSTFKTKAKLSPWTGQKLRGWTLQTWLAGKSVYQR